MKTLPYTLKIFLTIKVINVHFSDLDSLYTFLFALNALNHDVLYMVYDNVNDRLIDFYSSKHAQE